MIECFGLYNNGCIITVESKCKHETVPCPFYRTFSEHIASTRKAYARLSQLSEKKQQEISEKYYGGARPWRRE